MYKTLAIFSLLISTLWIECPPLQIFIPIAEAASDFNVQLKASHSTVEPEQVFVYTVKVKNRGNAREDATVILSLHDDIKVEYSSNDGKKRRGSIVWEDLSFGENESRTFTASVRIDDGANDGDTLTATALAGGGFDEVSIRVEDEDDLNNDNDRPITIELYSDKPQVEPGEPFSFIISLTNHGKRRVNGIEAEVNLDESLTFLSASNRGNGSKNSIKWKDIDIQGDETRTVTASVEVSEKAEHGESLFSTAYAEGSVFEHQLKVWDADFTAEQLKLYAFSDTEEITPGGKITYTLRVRNLADHDENATIEAYIAPETSFESASEGGMQFEKSLVIWERIPFDQSETKSFELTVVVDDDARPGTAIRTSFMAGVDRREIITGVIEPPQSNTGSNIMMSNLSASLFGTQTAEVQTENTQQQASVEITKHADKDEVQPGSNVTYAIRIRNMSDETLKNIQVVDRFPENAITIIDAGNGMIEKEGIFWSLLELKPHTQWSGTYQVRTAQSLKHGDVIQTITEAHVGENVIGQLVSKTNVITELPQAGEGPISRAFENAQETLQPVQKAQAYNESAIALPTKSPNKLPRIFWLLTIFAGAVLGICVGIRWPRKKHC